MDGLARTLARVASFQEGEEFTEGYMSSSLIELIRPLTPEAVVAGTISVVCSPIAMGDGLENAGSAPGEFMAQISRDEKRQW